MYNYLVAVSGGPDSMALLDLLRKYGLNLIVAHVNYNQRESALKDEMIVSDYCLKYNLKLFIKRFEGTYQGNFQNYARILRYDFFHELYHEYNCQALFLAHHNDDHLETFLIQKIQNRIPYTYGLNMISYYKDMKLIRPLLSLRNK